ncbi:sulfate transporter family-domain-containing protein [Coemansia spiralis]|nr:sulfate transporter family-domain-containing protein [Coemansia spiralis]
MASLFNRRRTSEVGAGSSSVAMDTGNRDSSPERGLEHASSLRSDTHFKSFDNARRGIGTRSMYIAPVPASGAADDGSANYSQTPDSIRDQTVLLSNMGLRPGLRDSISSNRIETTMMGLDGSHRSSLDDRSSIEQILVEAGSGGGNLSRLLRERSPPLRPLFTPSRGLESASTAGLPQFDNNYIGSTRVPRNAKIPEIYPLEQHQLSEDYDTIDGSPNTWLNKRQQPRVDAKKQHRTDLEAPSEQDQLLQSPSCSEQPYADADDSYAHLQRRGLAALDLITWPLQYVPAVILGLILNLLDGLSYGLIAFPVSIPVFDKFGPVGFSMYMLSTAISQFVFSSGTSTFRGANGSMLIEAIPFLHAISNTVVNSVGSSQPERIVATTLVAYALSTIITGVLFFLLGFLKIGLLVDFFPRHILVGCIGGVGYFLLQTGMEVTSGLKLDLSWSALYNLFVPNTLGLWGSSLSVAILLRILNARYTHPLFVPVFFILVPIAFYATTCMLGLSMNTLRASGWVFQLPEADKPFYYFYTLFDLGNTDWHSIKLTVPTMLGLAFFSILHVPINVPALAVSTNADKIDTNRELVAHGISNLVSGFLGSFQNYLVYSNSLLFIRSGGGSNLAGMMLGVATLGIFFSGPTIIGYIPTMVVGALIFHLGLELVREALLDTIGTVNRIEYATILSIVFAMAVLGFNEGIFLGILLACFFFILLYSRRSALRKAYTGSAVRSTVRRQYAQRRYLDGVCKQIQVMRLQGFMFFGTINGVEAYIRNLLEQRQWQANPIRFLVLDFALVNGMDFSAAEAFIRVRRLLEAREIYMVICGVERSSEVGRALRAAGVWSGEESEYVQTFASLNEALEWCENVLLQYYYLHQAAMAGTDMPQSYTFVSTPHPEEVHIYGSSPRHAMVSEATQHAMNVSRSESAPSVGNGPPALGLLQQAFHDMDSERSIDETLLFIAPHFVRKQLSSGQQLWQAGIPPVGMYAVESGTLRVYVDDGSGALESIESILPGTTLGELPLVTNKAYSTTVVADGNVAIWELSRKTFDDLCAREPEKMLAFIQLALAYSAQGVKAVTAYAFCAQ